MGIRVSNVGGPYTAAVRRQLLRRRSARLTTGDHTYTITATDKAGNSSTASGTFTITATAPTGPDDQPDRGGADQGQDQLERARYR